MLQVTPQHVPNFSQLDSRMDQSFQPTPNVQLPRRLARPPFAEVNGNAIATVAPELAGVPIEYIQKHLASLAPQYVFFSLHTVAPLTFDLCSLE